MVAPFMAGLVGLSAVNLVAANSAVALPLSGCCLAINQAVGLATVGLIDLRDVDLPAVGLVAISNMYLVTLLTLMTACVLSGLCA